AGLGFVALGLDLVAVGIRVAHECLPSYPSKHSCVDHGPVKCGIGRRRACLEGLSRSWARVPGIVIASGRITADTEGAHSERSLRRRGQVQAPRRSPAVTPLIP